MLSIVIPTYKREQVLIDTIQYLQPLRECLQQPTELLIIDQTERHQPETQTALTNWNQTGLIRWLRLSKPHLTRAMNRGLQESRGKIVLYLDDDIIPAKHLLQEHINAHMLYQEAWAVVGQVLQPGQIPEAAYRPKRNTSSLTRDLKFRFNSSHGAWIENAMGGNFSINRFRALEIGGFDMNFPPPVASRFETEFAKRLVRAGGKIRFAPLASIQHLAAGSGGTRSMGSHLTSASSRYGVGDCYFALRCGQGWELIWYLARKPFREVRTKFHLMHPWWILPKFFGELKALYRALKLCQKPPALLHSPSTAKQS